MSKNLRIIVLIGAVLAIFACNINNGNNETNDVTDMSFSGDEILRLTVALKDTTAVYNQAGQVINYVYSVTNGGVTPLAGPVTVADDRAGNVTCPELATIGNNNSSLDANETLVCAAAYTITQADVNAGSVTSNATAKAGAVTSNTVNTVVRMTVNRVLSLTITASPITYSQAGQTITYTYSIKNTGATTLGPAQFVVTDDKFSSPINCLGGSTILATNESVACSATYTITQADMSLNQITNSATAKGAGAETIQAATATITNTNVNPGGSSGFTRGTTIKHEVKPGEWLLQIARCYSADFNAVRNANPQVTNPSLILPRMVITVPNIGSNGTIYGPPCVGSHTVQSGDTWNSIALKYNADVAVLMEANKDRSLTNGTVLRIPLNSAGGTSPAPAPDAIRITFPTGSTTVSLSGSTGTQGKARYILTAAQGQLLSIKVTGPTNEIGLSVTSQNGSVLKQQDANLTWTGTIPANGDYFIEVANLLVVGSKSFTMEVGLTTPGTSSFVRLADVNQGAADSNPAFLTVFKNVLYFQAQGSDGAGTELWKYDQALQGVSRVADINQGAAGSEPSFLTPFGDMLYFKANGNDGAGAELWRYNGSAVGRVGDINTGAADSNPSYLTVFNGALYFSAKGSDGAGVELWKFDGNTSNRVADINQGPGDSNPSYLAVFNNALYFSANGNDGMGIELWKFDGVTATRVADINTGIGNSYPAFLTVFNNALYFNANGNDNTGIELWKYDGTTATRVADINPGAGDSVPTFLTVFNNALYFSANGNDAAGYELWKYDGTKTSRVSDINKAGDTSPFFLAVYNNELYFQANGNDGAGRELWKFKGP